MKRKNQNKYYNSRGKSGKEQVYIYADQLLGKAFEYFAWCEDNPWYKKEPVRSGERKGEFIEIPVYRPFTLLGLCVYCGISKATFQAYQKNEEMKDAAIHISDVIQQNQLEGTIVGAYNSSFVSRMLAFSDSDPDDDYSQNPFVVNVIDAQTKEDMDLLILNAAQA